MMGGRSIEWFECVNCKRLYEDMLSPDVEPCCRECLDFKHGYSDVNPASKHDPERDR